MTFPFNRQLDIVNLQNQKSPGWFCAVRLKAPAGFLADHFQLDPWFFPVEFTVRTTGVGPMPTLQRRPGEQGEVPDWDWLADTFEAARYPQKGSVVGRS
ncbi:hypothetical protein [Cupriavidus basilensis]|uniref:hypothetical protein n=1 Tax=Cupriavidus basilensis TaxID=68895 RepID=UPI0020A6623F|nr:hypothetical protein [Cupriavidus basilensis]MCP3025288.1 hypothetical protein [Cupriavidus basilensis]